MDRRQLKTRSAIYSAFTVLLERKNYNSITVQDIIDEANIGRSTFYAHFGTKDELLQALCDEIFAHVFSETLHKEATHDFSRGAKDMGERITHILYHLQDSRAYIKSILNSESGELFMRYFKAHLRDEFEQALHGENPSVPQDYLLNHMVCDFAESVRWWMLHRKYTPEDISRFYMTTVPDLKK